MIRSPTRPVHRGGCHAKRKAADHRDPALGRRAAWLAHGVRRGSTGHEEAFVAVPDTVSAETRKYLESLPDPATLPAWPVADDRAGWKRAWEAGEAASEPSVQATLKRYHPTVKEQKVGGVPVLDIKPKGWKDGSKLLVQLHAGAYTMYSTHSRLQSSVAAAARMEWNGVLIDADALARLRAGWEGIKHRLIATVDGEYGVFAPTGRRAPGPPSTTGAAGYTSPLRFSAERWGTYLARRGIPWPRLGSGALALDDDTFREMARLYPAEVGPIRELRHALSQMRLRELAVGSDGRNRCLLSAFGSKTGRNQPSNTAFIFGASCWLRSLIRPGVGRAMAYVDWSQQELGIAAALSGDRRMQEAYRSGDFYLTFAKMAGAVPAGATKQTHASQREQFKVIALGVLYGLSAEGLARKLNLPPCRGRELLRMHQETFRRFWAWSESVEMAGMLYGRLQTVFGWAVHVGPDANPRSLRNFPMQANGAEMMRLACCLATERGVTVCCPVHDALLVEGPAEDIDAVVSQTQRAMREASELVLPGFPLRTDVKVVRHPARYTDERGRRMWDTVWGLLAGGTPGAGATPTPGAGATLPVAPVLPPSSLISPSLSL
jgi:hypothetical protein